MNNMQVFLVFGFVGFLTSCQATPVDIQSYLLPRGGLSLIAALSRVKKDAESISDLEECAFVDSWQEQPGFINVLSFLDVSWEYSHRQATMLKMLQSRLETAGITGIRFFVINSAKPEAAVNIVDIEDERRAWSAADPNISADQLFTVIEKTREALKEKIGPDITFVQDTEELQIWHKLSASRDQVFVIDRCGRLSYRIIVPWSILHFPYVKAAILSTYKEEPCGVCDLETTTVFSKAETQTEELQDLLPKDWSSEQIKEIVVKKYNLDQIDDVEKKIYHGTESQEIPEDLIELLSKSANIKHENNTEFSSITKPEALMANGDINFDNIAYSPALDPMKDNHGDYENYTLNYAKSTEPSTIVNGSTEGSVNPEQSETTESIDLTIIVTELGATDNLENSNKSSDRLIDDDSSDQEDFYDSVSSIENQIKISSEDSSESNDYVIPIRIIMHAPHVHEIDEPRKKHEYLILKLGDPRYHGHLEYDDDFVPIENIEANSKNTTASEFNRSKEIEEVESGSGELSREEQNEKNIDLLEKVESQNLNIVYEKDESPGFYGEDAEYWRNFGNAAHDEKLNIELPSESINIGENISTTSESSLKGSVTEENVTTYENYKPHIVSGEEVEKNDKDEEEIANHLLEHYSKLIPWLDYIIE